MHHFADNRPWPDDGYLHDDVVKTARLQTGQAGHLRSGFHLKHADRVGLSECLIDGWIVLRQVCQVYLFSVCLANQLQGIFENCHHAEPQQVHFDDAHVGAIIFVPLDDNASRHGGGFERNDRIQLSLANHHAAGVLAQVPREVLNLRIQRVKFPD